MASIGIDLKPGVKSGLLSFFCSRSTQYGLEMHLAMMHKILEELNPDIIVMDPISNLITAGTDWQVKGMLIRLIDYLKMKEITSLYTDLTRGGEAAETTSERVSSLMDTWLRVRTVEGNGERNRTLNILKSRGMGHSNQIREFILSDDGIDLIDVYASGDTVLTGAARLAQQTQEKEEQIRSRRERELNSLVFEEKVRSIEAQIAKLQAEMKLEKTMYGLKGEEAEKSDQLIADRRRAMEEHRGADSG